MGKHQCYVLPCFAVVCDTGRASMLPTVPGYVCDNIAMLLENDTGHARICGRDLHVYTSQSTGKMTMWVEIRQAAMHSYALWRGQNMNMHQSLCVSGFNRFLNGYKGTKHAAPQPPSNGHTLHHATFRQGLTTEHRFGESSASPRAQEPCSLSSDDKYTRVMSPSAQVSSPQSSKASPMQHVGPKKDLESTCISDTASKRRKLQSRSKSCFFNPYGYG